MDAEHRHELKQNDLADWLGHLPTFLKKNSNTILGVLLICVALTTWPMFNKMRDKKDLIEQNEITQSIQLLDQDAIAFLRAPADDPAAQTEALNKLLVNADTLLEKASDIDKPNLAALARIKAAQAIRTQLHLRKTVDADMLETQIQKAEDAYQKAFEIADIPTLQAMAQFGLGLCSEELGQSDQAAEIYQQIIDNEAYQATVLPTQAQQRLDALEENTEPFNFAEAPVVIEDLSLDRFQASPAGPTEAAIPPAESTAETTAEVTQPAAEETNPAPAEQP